MTAALVALCITQPLAFAGLLWLVLRSHDRKDHAIHLLAAQGNQTASQVIQAMAEERERTAKQIQALLQRIQAPEKAIAAHDTASHEPGTAQYPLTDEESVLAQDERLAALAALEQIRAAERELDEVTV